MQNSQFSLGCVFPPRGRNVATVLNQHLPACLPSLNRVVHRLRLPPCPSGFGRPRVSGFRADAMDCSDVLKQGTKPLGVGVDAVAFLESTLDEISSICSNEAGKPPCFACAVVHNALKSPALQRSS